MRILTLKVLILFGCLVDISSCAYHEYDSNKPEEYIRYWCNPNNYKNTIQGEIIDKNGNDEYQQECDMQKKWTQ